MTDRNALSSQHLVSKWGSCPRSRSAGQGTVLRSAKDPTKAMANGRWIMCGPSSSHRDDESAPPSGSCSSTRGVMNQEIG
jgi:hypothetical protein